MSDIFIFKYSLTIIFKLTKSKLMLIKNLIGNLERLGIVHILVNDGTIPSWVDPYA